MFCYIHYTFCESTDFPIPKIPETEVLRHHEPYQPLPSWDSQGSQFLFPGWWAFRTSSGSDFGTSRRQRWFAVVDQDIFVCKKSPFWLKQTVAVFFFGVFGVVQVFLSTVNTIINLVLKENDKKKHRNFSGQVFRVLIFLDVVLIFGITLSWMNNSNLVEHPHLELTQNHPKTPFGCWKKHWF